jgi:hypothetical protein
MDLTLRQKCGRKGLTMDLEDILAVLLEDCEIDDILIEEYEDFFIIEA